MLNQTIKEEFGRHLRNARDTRKLSRAALGLRLGISPKTIQSWEMGRTFIEDLALIPAIETELSISVSQLISQALGGGKVSDSAGEETYEPIAIDTPRPGPLHPRINVVSTNVDTETIIDERNLDVVVVPMIRESACEKPVSQLTKSDIERHVSIPFDWVPRGGVLIACRMNDSGMDPTIHLGAIIIVDRRPPSTPEKFIDRIVMMYLNRRGVRVRRLTQDIDTKELEGQTAIPNRRGKVQFKPEIGDKILGKIVGVLAQPE